MSKKFGLAGEALRLLIHYHTGPRCNDVTLHLVTFLLCPPRPLRELILLILSILSTLCLSSTLHPFISLTTWTHLTLSHPSRYQ